MSEYYPSLETLKESFKCFMSVLAHTMLRTLNSIMYYVFLHRKLSFMFADVCGRLFYRSGRILLCST